MIRAERFVELVVKIITVCVYATVAYILYLLLTSPLKVDAW